MHLERLDERITPSVYHVAPTHHTEVVRPDVSGQWQIQFANTANGLDNWATATGKNVTYVFSVGITYGADDGYLAQFSITTQITPQQLETLVQSNLVDAGFTCTPNGGTAVQITGAPSGQITGISIGYVSNNQEILDPSQYLPTVSNGKP